jgi:hypothetical protein
MSKFKRNLAFMAVPAVLALGALSYGSVVAFAAASPSPTPSPTGTTAPSAAEPAESATAAETVEPNEPALSGGGYADAANSQADTQQDGVY